MHNFDVADLCQRVAKKHRTTAEIVKKEMEQGIAQWWAQARPEIKAGFPCTDSPPTLECFIQYSLQSLRKNASGSAT